MLNRFLILTDVPIAGMDQDLPARHSLGQNYPNPFNPQTTIMYSLPKRAEVTITIYNLLGQRVRVFDEGEKRACLVGVFVCPAGG